MLLYRLLFALALPLLLWRGRQDWRARLLGPKLDEPRVWLHGASVGELAAVRPIIAALQDVPTLVTCNTTTARDMVASWDMDHVQVALARLDRAALARRMIKQCRALIIVENEVWPEKAVTVVTGTVARPWSSTTVPRSTVRSAVLRFKLASSCLSSRIE